MWFFQVKFWSIITPKNFINRTCLRKSLFIFNVTSVFNNLFFDLTYSITYFFILVLEELIDNLFALSHFTTLFISFCIVLDKVFKHEFE